MHNGQKFDFLEVLAKHTFTAYETRVLLTLIKWQLVYGGGGVIISLGRISHGSGLPTPHVCRALRGLLQKGAVNKTQKNDLPYYSLLLPNGVLPIKAEGLPNGAEGVLPIEAIKLPIRAEVIKDSNKELNNNISEDFKKKTEERLKAFADEYPGAWHKGIWTKALGHFLNSTPAEQETFLSALKAYKNSKPVKDKKILSPLNFLSSPKIIKQYSEEAAPKRRQSPDISAQVEEWKRRAAADPVQAGKSLLKEFDELVKTTAAEKAAPIKKFSRAH